MSFICFDTEDDSKELLSAGKSGFDKTVTQIAAISRSSKRFYNKGNVQEFLKWLDEQPERFVYSLNIQYDLGNLFADELDSLDLTLVGGRVIKAVWGSKVFVDVFNIWPMSVKKLGETFGLKKLELDIHSKAYVFRDVEIIFKAMDYAWDFAQELEIAPLPNTLGGLCVKVWKHFNGQNCHDTNPLSKEAYYGGRVELFKHKNESKHVAYTDINSLYPSQMLKEFPAELYQWEDDRLPKFGIVKAHVKLPKLKVGVLPFRADDDRILYPYGEFTGTWTVPEIVAAKERGGKIDLIECWGTDESITPYRDFVLQCYEMRMNSKTDSEKTFFKLLMNNLYGRLGTGGVIGRTVWQDENNCDDGICYGAKVLVNYKMPLSVETNWGHAAYVTAYGRLTLLSFIETIGVDNMIYCDTDSCIFDCPSQQLPFKVSMELGQMKLESWETDCECFAPKMYKRQNRNKPNETDKNGNKLRDATGSDFKAKGVPKTLAKQFIETGRVDFDLPFKMREAIRFFDRQNKRKLSVWRNVEKFAHTCYDKKKRVGNRYFPLQVMPD